MHQIENNPYASSTAASTGTYSFSGVISSQLLTALNRTIRWTRLTAILGLLISGLLFLGVLVMAGFLGSFGGINGSGQAAPTPVFFGLLILFMIMLPGFLFSWKLIRYGSALKTTTLDRKEDSFLFALRQQHTAWVILVIVLSFFLVASVLGLISNLVLP